MFDESIKEFEARVRRLERLACPTPADRPLFEREMLAAEAAGMTYRECLEHVIRIRNGGSD